MISRFWILDFGFWIEAVLDFKLSAQQMSMIVQSKIQNLKSKIASIQNLKSKIENSWS